MKSVNAVQSHKWSLIEDESGETQFSFDWAKNGRFSSKLMVFDLVFVFHTLRRFTFNCFEFLFVLTIGPGGTQCWRERWMLKDPWGMEKRIPKVCHKADFRLLGITIPLYLMNKLSQRQDISTNSLHSTLRAANLQAKANIQKAAKQEVRHK